MMNKSLVLLSGGLDSVVNFKLALDNGPVSLILTFDYGQKAAEKEIESARGIAEQYQIPFQVIVLDWMKNFQHGLSGNQIPDFETGRFDDFEYQQKTAGAVWIPNRNGVMLNIAASIAENSGINQVITGFNAEEGATFPDNTEGYLNVVNRSFEYSCSTEVKIVCYTIEMNKKELLKAGIKHRAPLNQVWSCYHNGEKMCTRCESCRRLIRALNDTDYYQDFISISRWGFEEI